LLTGAYRDLPIEVFVGKTSEIIELADCALMKSGSVSMEMMARGTPSTVIYHASRSTYTVGRMLTRLKSMTLPNLIAGETVMPEFIAVGRSTGKVINQATKAMKELIGNSEIRDSQKRALQQLTHQYGQPGASRRAAEIIATDLHSRRNDLHLSTTLHAA
jgi:lipid-A-disaccharide synthase